MLQRKGAVLTGLVPKRACRMSSRQIRDGGVPHARLEMSSVSEKEHMGTSVTLGSLWAAVRISVPLSKNRRLGHKDASRTLSSYVVRSRKIMRKRRKVGGSERTTHPNKTAFLDLTDELLQLVATYLRFEDLWRLEQVSKRCRAVVRTDWVWYSMYRQTWIMPRRLTWQQFALLR